MAAPYSLKLRFALTSICCLSLLIAGCKSPEQQEKERADKIKQFATKVAKELLDRNPLTLRESVNLLRAQELMPEAIAKLEKQETIPNAGLDVLKEVQIAEDAKSSNVVQVTDLVPVGPITKDVVPVKVSGTNTLKVQGKPDVVKPFTLTISVKLTPEMAGYPMVTDVEGLKTTDFHHQHGSKEARGGKKKK